MDVKGIRTLNLIGTILFALFSIAMPMIYIPFILFVSFNENNDFMLVFLTIMICWIIFIIYITCMLYRNTVLGMDLGHFEEAKKWVLYGIVLAIVPAFNLIVLIIFLVSYVSIEDAIRPKYYPPPPGYYPPPPYYETAYHPTGPQYQQSSQVSGFCPKCRRPVEANWKYCINCHESLK